MEPGSRRLEAFCIVDAAAAARMEEEAANDLEGGEGIMGPGRGKELVQIVKVGLLLGRGPWVDEAVK